MKPMCYPSRLTRFTGWAAVPLVLNLTDVCQLLGKTEPTIRRMLERGDLHGVKAGREWIIEKSEGQNFLRGAKE